MFDHLFKIPSVTSHCLWKKDFGVNTRPFMIGPTNSSAPPPVGMWVHPEHLPQAFLAHILRLSQGSLHVHKLSPPSRMHRPPLP